MPQTVRSDISRTTQIGVQTVFGTGVAANLRFPSLQWARMKPTRAMRKVKPSTFKAPTNIHGGKESQMFSVTSDGITYDEMAYTIESAVKTVTATGATAKIRAVVPSISAQDTRKLYTLEDGQVGNLWKAQDGFFTGFKLTSQPDSVDYSAEFMGADITIPAALTASPTQIPSKPILVERVGVFNATTFANLAVSPVALDNALKCELDFSKIQNAYYRLKQGERSYAGTVEVIPELKVNLTCAIDQAASEISGAQFTLAQWRAGTVTFLRWQAVTTDFIETTIPWELTFDMALMVGEPFVLEEDQGLSVITWPCVVAADSLGNWLSIKSVTTTATL